MSTFSGHLCISATTIQASSTEGLEMSKEGGKRNKTVFFATFSLASSDTKTALEFLDSGLQIGPGLVLRFLELAAQVLENSMMMRNSSSFQSIKPTGDDTYLLF